jgi:hypothetical protein
VDALTRPGNLVFDANTSYRDNLEQAGGRVVRQPSGHLVFYTKEGRRFLYTDPDGQALHECEWELLPHGTARLHRARVWLDWDQWIGLTPQGLINESVLNLSTKPGWQALTPDDLRAMAAQAMAVSLDDVRFFYGDGDLTISPEGRATIRHRKDTFSILHDGTFERATFMACMGAMHWATIDFLPVVELFQSMLPGTGSAVLELIRALYDDQRTEPPRPLRYRGIPAYPSQAAYRLFSQFFTPQAPGGEDPLPVFMNPSRSSHITWLPAADPPLRYRDVRHNAAVTIKGGQVQKVTLSDDPAGVSYLSPSPSGFAPCDRRIAAEEGMIVLFDGSERRSIPIPRSWGVATTTASPPSGSPPGWRSLFAGEPPHVSPRDAFASVSLYPADETEIGEVASQPFVADYLEDLGEDDPVVRRWLARSERVFIGGFDASVPSLMQLDRPRDYLVSFRWPAVAQKQAQAIWNYLAQTRRLEWAQKIRFSEMPETLACPAGSYDGLYLWLPFGDWNHAEKLTASLLLVHSKLARSGLAFVVGPPSLPALAQSQGWTIQTILPVADLPTFQMHRNILPKARLKTGLTLCQMSRA